MHWFVCALVFTSVTIDALTERESKTWEPEFDEDDDIDPFEDDDDPIQYPVKSVMPKRVMEESHAKILQDNGSGHDSKSMVMLAYILFYTLCLNHTVNYT